MQCWQHPCCPALKDHLLLVEVWQFYYSQDPCQASIKQNVTHCFYSLPFSRMELQVFTAANSFHPSPVPFLSSRILKVQLFATLCHLDHPLSPTHSPKSFTLLVQSHPYWRFATDHFYFYADPKVPFFLEAIVAQCSFLALQGLPTPRFSTILTTSL